MINLNTYIVEKFKLNKTHEYRVFPEVGDSVLILIYKDKDNSCDATTAKIVSISDYREDAMVDEGRFMIRIKYDTVYHNTIYPQRFITDKDKDYDARPYNLASSSETKLLLLFKDKGITLLEDFLKRYLKNGDNTMFRKYKSFWDKYTEEMINDTIKILEK